MMKSVEFITSAICCLHDRDVSVNDRIALEAICYISVTGALATNFDTGYALRS